MRRSIRCLFPFVTLVAFWVPLSDAAAQGTRSTETYKRIKAQIDAVPAIDTHDHLWPFERLPALTDTADGKVVNLAGIWRNSYYTWYNPISPWQASESGRR